jgi:AAA domain
MLPPTPRASGDATTDEQRVRRYIEGIAAHQAMLGKGNRNSREFGGAKDAFRYAMGANIPDAWVEDLIYEANVRNGQVADDGERQVRGTIKQARDAAQAAGPDYLPERPFQKANGTHIAEVSAAALAPTGTEGAEPDPIWGSRPPVDAAAFLFDGDDDIPALWGDGDDILWVEGEALMIAGGMGLGKTTLAGQLVRAQLGLNNAVFDLPVAPIDGKILYLAMDRPRQIRRSMRRQFDHTERDQIRGRFEIRTGPPIADLAANPTLLARMAESADAAVVYVDSLKDAAIGLSNDEVGAGYNRARQHLLAQNRQLCELHHLVKRGPGGAPPNSVADIYGSTWLTSGCGSVVILTGDPGDPIIEFKHAKQPIGEVGPWRLLHNQENGAMTINHQVDLIDLVAHCGPNGLTAQGAAAALFSRDKPTRGQIEKARYRLDKLHDAGLLKRLEGSRGGAQTAWFLPNVGSESNQTFYETAGQDIRHVSGPD